ncbi:alpha/beta-hydrolase [Agrocybe pediades]|nr:alpha/beta-hydrolase [Agrocybe pediades]
MPVPDFNTEPFPKLHHLGLETTFCGIEHPLSTSETSIHQYRGIKYASIPVRFRQSKLCTSYPPIYDASRHGPICPQLHTKPTEEILFGVPHDEVPTQHLEQNEFECLNLNITLPAGLTPRSKVPVMLWIHGGGDRGSGSHWYYDAGSIVRKSIQCNKPVIVVTFNFRLGLLGFATSAMIRDDNKAAGEVGTGNYGLRDQRMANLWVHNYISEFGGDPSNITLFGSGSGAADIVCHLLSRENATHPIFHRCIIQSAIFEPTFPDVGSAGWYLSRIMSALQVSTIEKLRHLEVEKLLGLGSNLRAVDDGVFFREGWQSYFGRESAHGHHHHMENSKPVGCKTHQQSHRGGVVSHKSKSKSRSRPPRSKLRSQSRPGAISGGTAAQLQPAHCLQPLIIGDSSADSLLWSNAISLWTSAGVTRRLKAICQSLSKTSAVMRAYDISSNTPDDEITERVLELVNDARVAWPTHCIAENAAHERGGQGVWRFVFDQEGPSRGVPHHAADLMYLFDNVPLPATARISPYSDIESYFDDPIDEDSPEIFVSPGNMSEDEDDEMSSRGRTRARGESFGSSLVAKCESLTNNGGRHLLEREQAMVDSDEWLLTHVDEYSYMRVRDAMQERWISFAHGEVPWREDKVFVFGPEGETGERSNEIFEGRRRRRVWREAFEPLGPALVQKCGVELCRGPAMGADVRS